MSKSVTELPRMGRIKRIHFVGIGGVGMCGIAEILVHDGYQISGSDNVSSKATQRLEQIGAQVLIGHHAEHISEVDVVVQSTAVHDDNAEIIAAKAANVPVIPRAEMLAELMRYKQGIAISGTHGKTTTTSFVSSILLDSGLDPSFVIGGKLTGTQLSAKLGQSPYFVAEADESDASFLHLKPTIAVVTNIDADHMATYNGSVETLRNAFIEFLHHLPFHGLAILCLDDEGVRRILPEVKRPVITYGFEQGADIRASDWHQKDLCSHFTVHRPDRAPLAVICALPGRHNVQNALAAIAIATELGVSDKDILQSLAEFKGVGRRFQMHGEHTFRQGRAMLIDDYGHHPKEVSATVDAIRKVWPDKRLVLAFQPHRYSRTESLFDDFVDVLSQVDELVLLAVYSAGEAPIIGVSHLSLAEKIHTKQPSLSVAAIELGELGLALDKVVREGDIVLTQGAGSIGLQLQSLVNHEQSSVC